MKILVTVKRVTDTEQKVRLAPDGSGIALDGMNFVINPFDEIAVEEALRLQKVYAAEVVIASVGTRDASTQIRSALAMGADRGVLVVADHPLDPDAVARTLARVVKDETPDLVLMGKQAPDDDAVQTGQLLATYLDWPQITFASKEAGLESEEERQQSPAIKIADGTVTAAREVDGGIEVLEATLPAVITVDLRLNKPRYASLPGIMKAKKKEIKEIPIAQYGIDLAPRVRVLKYEEPASRKAGVRVSTVQELVEKLKNEARVI